MGDTAGGWTRRDFLMRLGALAGTSAVYQAMASLGMLVVPPAYAGPPRLPGGSGRGKKVVIVGAGIAGLTSAWELSKAGYEITLLEATQHVGGRNRTVRHGDTLHEVDSKQVCSFDDEPHLYFNAGPARLPYHHGAVMAYCREFGVALEPFINTNGAAWLHDSKRFGGKPQRQHRVQTDTRGYLSELLAKALSPASLGQVMSAEEVDGMKLFLRAYGDLTPDYTYKGSNRAGSVNDSVMELGKPHAPLPMHDLFGGEFMQWKVSFAEDVNQHPTMMQPVGGMDMIPRAFLKRVGHMITRGAPVTSIMNEERGVRVRYQAPDGSGEREILADFCINNAPGYLVLGMHNNFSAAYREGLEKIRPGKLFKIAFQGKRRFWEEDDQIFGGISWTDQDITQMWYPPHGFMSKKGVLLASYTFAPQIGDKWSAMTPAARLRAAIEQCSQLHPGFGDKVEAGVSVAWQKVPYMFGCAPELEEQDRAKYFPRLRQAEGRHYLVGDQMTYQSGWQEGAIRSAHLVVEDIAERTATA